MSFEKITPNNAEQLLQQGANVIDVRDALSFQAAHIKGAQRIDNDNISQFMQSTSKEDPLLVYCFHGQSSQGVASFFAQQGYLKVYSLEGGFEQWKLLYPDWVTA